MARVTTDQTRPSGKILTLQLESSFDMQNKEKKKITYRHNATECANTEKCTWTNLMNKSTKILPNNVHVVCRNP